MLRRLTAILLIITSLASGFTRLFVCAGFELNKEYIASALCENRDKPALMCNGKCYLAKKIKQAEDKEKSQERQLQKNSFQEAFITQKLTLKIHSVFIQMDQSPDLSFILPRYSLTIFHPPSA